MINQRKKSWWSWMAHCVWVSARSSGNEACAKNVPSSPKKYTPRRQLLQTTFSRYRRLYVVSRIIFLLIITLKRTRHLLKNALLSCFCCCCFTKEKEIITVLFVLALFIFIFIFISMARRFSRVGHEWEWISGTRGPLGTLR